MLLDLLSQEWVNDHKARVCLDYSALICDGRIVSLRFRFPDGITVKAAPATDLFGHRLSY
jgi:hypothetical protein